MITDLVNGKNVQWVHSMKTIRLNVIILESLKSRTVMNAREDDVLKFKDIF